MTEDLRQPSLNVLRVIILQWRAKKNWIISNIRKLLGSHPPKVQMPITAFFFSVATCQLRLALSLDLTIGARVCAVMKSGKGWGDKVAIVRLFFGEGGDCWSLVWSIFLLSRVRKGKKIHCLLHLMTLCISGVQVIIVHVSSLREGTHSCVNCSGVTLSF